MALEHVSGGIDMAEIRARIEKLTGRPFGSPDLHTEPEDYLAAAHSANAEHRRAMSRKLSTIPEEFVDASLDKYVATEGNGRAIVAAERAIKSSFRAGLGLYGDPGVGKSMLAAIIANCAIEQGRMTLFLSVRRMLDTIKDTYNADAEQQERASTELGMIKRYAGVDVLVLNDLGKEPLTKWSIEMLYAIFDDRWEQGRPLILTANLSWVDLCARYRATMNGLDESTGPAMMDRVAGMTSMPWVCITGDSQRWGV